MLRLRRSRRGRGLSRKGETMTTEIENVEQWATVELMGHAQTAGRISRPSDWSGLLRVDVPLGKNGDYRTEFYGLAAIYSVKLVSREIATAYAQPSRGVVAYDSPIVTREQHEAKIDEYRRNNETLRDMIRQLERRLTAVDALPAPQWEPPTDVDDDEDPGDNGADQ